MRRGMSRGAGRGYGGLAVAVVAALLLSAGCSMMEKAGEATASGIKSVASALNPVNWFEDSEPDYMAGKTAVAEKPPTPGADESPDGTQPPLSSVPDRPKDLTSSQAKAARKEIRDGLAADAENARHAAEALRARQPGVAGGDRVRSQDRVAAMNGAGGTENLAPSVPGGTMPVGPVPTVTVPAGNGAATDPAEPRETARAAVQPAKQALQTQQGALRSVQVATIYFADGSANLTNLDRQIVRQVAEVAQRTGGNVRIIGHSSVGDPSPDPARQQSNYRVSLKRANAVAAELQRYGLPVDRLQVSARGDSEPVYLETAATGAAGNRRAEVFLDYFQGT